MPAEAAGVVECRRVLVANCWTCGDLVHDCHRSSTKVFTFEAARLDQVRAFDEYA